MDAIAEFTRDLLMSIHPRHASNILRGEKTVELRRRFGEANAASTASLTKP
jgi:predicted transcriptional regulator